MGILKERAAALRAQAEQLEKQEDAELASVKFGGTIYFEGRTPRLIVSGSGMYRLPNVLLVNPQNGLVGNAYDSLEQLKTRIGMDNIYTVAQIDAARPMTACEAVYASSKPAFSFANPFDLR